MRAGDWAVLLRVLVCREYLDNAEDLLSLSCVSQGGRALVCQVLLSDEWD